MINLLAGLVTHNYTRKRGKFHEIFFHDFSIIKPITLKINCAALGNKPILNYFYSSIENKKNCCLIAIWVQFFTIGTKLTVICTHLNRVQSFLSIYLFQSTAQRTYQNLFNSIRQLKDLFSHDYSTQKYLFIHNAIIREFNTILFACMKIKAFRKNSNSSTDLMCKSMTWF